MLEVHSLTRECLSIEQFLNECIYGVYKVLNKLHKNSST